VAAAPESTLVQRFGPNLGRDLRRRARFEGGSGVGAPRKVVSESRERTFERDLVEPAELREALARMARELCAGLGARGRRGRTIAIKVRLDDFTTVTRARTVAEATCEGTVVERVALELLDAYAPKRPVRLLGVRVAGLAQGTSIAHDQDEREGSRDARVGERDQLALPM
jgi:DNA polymerase-4